MYKIQEQADISPYKIIVNKIFFINKTYIHVLLRALLALEFGCQYRVNKLTN